MRDVAKVTNVIQEAGVAMSGNNQVLTDLLTVSEIAGMMRVSKMTVYRLVQSGALQGIRFGRSYRVPKASVDHYLESINPDY